MIVTTEKTIDFFSSILAGITEKKLIIFPPEGEKVEFEKILGKPLRIEIKKFAFYIFLIIKIAPVTVILATIFPLFQI